MMKKIVLVIGCCLALVVSSCHKKSEQEKFNEKIENLTVGYAKVELGLGEVDSIRLISVDTLTAFAYVNFIIPYVEEMRADFQTQYEQMVKIATPEQLTEMEGMIEDVIQAENFYHEVVIDESVDNKKPLLYLVRAEVFKDGPKDIVNFFATTDFQIHNFDPTDYSIIEK